MVSRRSPGTLEAEVLGALAAASRPMSAAEVRAALGSTLAYTTVMTVLARLADKGLAAREQRGRAHVYSPVRDEAEITALRMRRILSAGEDRAGALAHFVGKLSDAEEAILYDVLRGVDRDTAQ